MTLVNCCVVLEKRNGVLYPWKITSSQISAIALRGYYNNVIEPQLKISDDLQKRLQLTKGYLGKSKESLDLIDLDIDLNLAIGTFGSFIKYVVDDEREEELAAACAS